MKINLFFLKIVTLSLGLILGIFAEGVAQGSRMTDSLALVDLYNSTNGANWTNKWTLTQPMTSWYGVTLSNGRVFCLNLSGDPTCTSPISGTGNNGNNLIGTIPNLNLPKLESLFLSFNKLSGTIPNFNNLISLKWLDLERNQLTGSIPNFNLPNLVSIDLQVNNLSGSIPNFNMPNLIQIILFVNRLSGNIPNFNLPNLQYLYLSSNQLSGSIPNFNLPKLQALYLDYNQLNGSIPNFNLPQLQFLYLYSNKLNGSIPNFNLPNLQYLRLESNLLSGCIPKGIKANCPLIGPNTPTGGLNSFGGNISNNPNLATQSWANYWNNNEGACLDCTTATASITGKTSICGTSAITLTATTNLVSPTFAWSTGATTANITISTPATYNVTITQSDGCVKTASIVVSADNSCRCSDSLQLVSLYNATAGANWTNKWDLAQPMTTWYGVTLNASGCVICIDMDGVVDCTGTTGTGNNLVGILPNLNLANLQVFCLGYNKLSGSIPNFNLLNLKTLWLNANQLSGDIPNFSLTNLQSLALNGNLLSGSIPNFNNLPNLTNLYLGNNQLNGNIPNFNIPNLKDLVLGVNQLSGSIPNLKLPNLLYLFLSSNQLSGCIPQSIKTNCPLIGTSNGFIDNNPNLATQNWANYWNNNEGACLTCTSATASITGKTNICGISTITLMATTNLVSPTYIWSTGATTPNITVSIPATYNVTITQSDGCVKTASIMVSADNSCRCSDSLQLVALYNATGGPNWRIKTNWLTTNPINTWYGVTLNANGCIYCIDLDGNASCDLSSNSGNGLVGAIPNLNLPNLQGLYLSNNELNGSIPNFNLPKLQWLDLPNNRLSNTIPNFNLPNLQYLYLYDNQLLNGTIPNFNLPNLKTLALSGNQLNNSIPNFNLPNLQELFLDDNQLSGIIPNLNLPKLELFHFENNKIDSTPRFTNLSNIKKDTTFWRGLRSHKNKLTFDDILPNMGFATTATFIYSPQDSIFKDTTITARVGDPLSIDLKIDGGITDNAYSWKRNGNSVTSNGSSNLNRFIRNAVSLTDAGVYTCEVKNSRAPDLTLSSRKITVVVLPTLVDTNSCRYKDSFALIALYDATDGNNWRKKTNWKSNRPLNEWYGIYTNTEGCVTCIDLDGTMNYTWSMDSMGNNLRGQLPNAIGNMSKLDRLILNGNQGLTGTLPTNFGGMTELSAFWANDCRFTAPFPNSLWSMPKLEDIDLTNNPLNTTPPSNFSLLPKLSGLLLPNTGLYGTVPNSWSGKLWRRVQLEENKIDSLPDLSRFSYSPGCNCHDSLFTFQNNNVTFDDILPTLSTWQRNVPITYAPQAQFFKDTIITVRVGAPLSIDLKIDGALTSNRYVWVKDGARFTELGDTLFVNKLNIPNVQARHAGIYEVYVTNPNAPLLTLISRKIKIVVTDNTTCSYRDSLALIALYDATNGDRWINTINNDKKWKVPGVPIKNWYGVYTNTEGCVVTLDLDGINSSYGEEASGNGLNGTLPDALFSMPNLELLLLNGSTNKLSSLPNSIGRASKLRELQLENCGVSSLSDSVWTLSSLEGLVLNNNPLNRTLPNTMGGLRNIIRLHFANCQIKGALPESLANLTKLRFLDMRNNQIDSFPNISQLPLAPRNLAYFRLDNNKLTFDDFLKNTNLFAIDSFVYTPQAQFFKDTTIIARIGDPLSIDLKIDAGIGSNRYVWWKDNARFTELGDTLFVNKLNIPRIQASHAGTYEVRVTNPNAQFLTLVSYKIKIIVADNNSCRYRDSLALVDVHGTTDGANWTPKDTIIYGVRKTSPWNLNLPMTSWYDLRLNALGCVDSISFEGSGAWRNPVGLGLSGNFPTAICRLSELIYLNLRMNKNLKGRLPDSIQYLKKLEYLYLDGCSFTGPLPNGLRYLSALKEFVIAKNPLQTFLPSFLGDLLNLEAFGTENDSLTGTVPPAIGQISNLTRLLWAKNGLSGSIPSTFSQRLFYHFSINDNSFDSLPRIQVKDYGWWWFDQPFFQIQGNRFTFDDILPSLVGIPSTFYVNYAPQDSIFQEITLTKNVGETANINLGIDGALTTNKYVWFKKQGNIWTRFDSSNVNTLILRGLSACDAGDYKCEVTNPAAPLLTLKSRTIKIVVNGALSSNRLDTAICYGQTYRLPNLQTVSATTSFRDTVKNIRQCDSLIRIVNLTVSPKPDSTVQNAAICFGKTYTLPNGQIVTPSVNTMYRDTILLNGCPSRFRVTNLTVNALPTPIVNDTAICSGNSARLWIRNNSPNFRNYQWQTNSATTASANYIPSVSSTYFVTVTDANGCIGTDSARITVNSKPTAQITNLNSLYCKDNSTVTLQGQPTGGTFRLDGNTALNFNTNAVGIGNHSLNYIYRDANNCADTAVKTFHLADIARNTINRTICSGDTITINQKKYYKNKLTGIDTLRNASKDGCDSILTVQIAVYPKIRAYDDSTSIGQDKTETTINVLTNDIYPINMIDVNIINKPRIGSIEDKGTGLFNIEMPRAANGFITFNYEICLMGCPNDCDTAMVKVFIKNANPKDIISIGMTPNGDGNNDVLDFPEIDWIKYPDARMEIFNRWGQFVFVDDHYKGKWGGLNQNGQELMTGDYFFILRLDINEGKIIVGSVYLQR